MAYMIYIFDSVHDDDDDVDRHLFNDSDII